MLAALWIENYALVDTVSLEFDPGFTVLTGETGAGKSIIVGALQLALGERADLARMEGAAVSAEFVLEEGSPGLQVLADMGLAADGGRVVLSRRIRRGGGVARINGQPATVGMLRQLGEALVDFHGQHEHQSLLRPTRHLDFIDAYGGEALSQARGAYSTLFHERRRTLEALQSLRARDRESRRQEDLLRYQLGEIDSADLDPDEEERLKAERRLLVHAERLATRASEAWALLTGDEEAGAAREPLAAAVTATQELAEIDPQLAAIATELQGALITVEEAARVLGDYAASVELDDGRLEAIEARLSRLQDLKRKYGDTIPDVLAFRDRIAQ